MSSSVPGPRPRGLGRDELVAAVAAGAASLPTGARVVVAVSGGPDSTALAYLLTEARPDLVPVVAHVRHGLRDDAADAEVVRRHAALLGVEVAVREVEVVPAGRGTEAAARDARYAALRAVAAAAGASAIAIGHTADDQAETVLLRLARGTGTAGLAGMAVRAGDLVRPLLRVRRADVHAFVAGEGLATAVDPTNADPGVRRVRVRDAVLPALATVAGDPVGALARAADLAAADEAALDALAAELIARSAVAVGPTWSVPVAAVAGAPLAVRRRVRRRLVTAVSGGPPPSAAALAAVADLAAGRRHRLPGDVEVAAAGGWWTVAPATVARVAARRLAVPGVTAWAPAGVRVVARTPGVAPAAGSPAPAGQIAFELTGAWSPPAPVVADLAAPPGGDRARAHVSLAGGDGLRLRHRRDGDRIHARTGTARVVDVLGDAGVPRAVRDRWPLVVDADDRVVWVPGVAVDAAAHAAGLADPAVQLVVEPTEPGV